MYVQYVNPIITVVSKVVFKMLCGLRMIEITSQYVRNLQMRQLKDVWLAVSQSGWETTIQLPSRPAHVAAFRRV